MAVDDYSFNRYMVECKSSTTREILNAIRGFNRYMVECKCICIW